MPPITQRANVERTGETIFIVQLAIWKPEQERAVKKAGETHYATTLDTAFTIAFGTLDINGHPKVMRSPGVDLMVFEPHEDGEEYQRVTIKERPILEDNW